MRSSKLPVPTEEGRWGKEKLCINCVYKNACDTFFSWRYSRIKTTEPEFSKNIACILWDGGGRGIAAALRRLKNKVFLTIAVGTRKKSKRQRRNLKYLTRGEQNG